MIKVDVYEVLLLGVHLAVPELEKSPRRWEALEEWSRAMGPRMEWASGRSLDENYWLGKLY
jgi:hypothetical protein